MKKAEGKAVIDYGFHMIITELNDQVEREMDALVRQGVTSFKLFMAYPGVFMLDDASIFKALLRTGKNGGTICMHAENGGVIDVLVQRALAEGKTAPKYHALTRPARAEAEATHRAIALAEIADVPIYIVHLSAAEALEMVTEARDRGLPAYAETCPQYLFLSYDNYEEPGLRRREVRDEPAAARQGEAGSAVARPRVQRPAVHLDRPLPVLHEGAEGARRRTTSRRFPNGAPGIETRMSLVYDGGVRAGPHLAQPLRRADVDVAGEDLRPVPAQGHDRAGLRRRHRRLRSEPDDHAGGEDAAHERATTTRTRAAR